VDVLRAHGVVVTKQDGDEFVISKGPLCEVQLLPSKVHRNTLHRLARVYDVDVHRFFHAEDTRPVTPRPRS